MKMKVAEAIVQMLEKEGITHAFGIPGAGINGLYKYMAQSQIQHFTHRHEECCVHAAGGYFRASGNLAVALCTSGPGATNFVTGLYSCNIDSIPVIAITGQGARAQFGKDAFQCVDIVSIAKPVVKWACCLNEPDQVPEKIREGFRLAREGKPGAILLDLPLDVQNSEIEFEIDAYIPAEIQTPAPREEEIAAALSMISSAKKPIMIMGGGVLLSGATEECVKLAEKLNMPVITTYMAKGGIPIEHPLNAGHCGIQVGQPIGNKILLESDLVLGIGCRFTDRHTGDIAVYRGDRKFIHINISAQEIGKIFEPEIGIVSDAKLAINAMLQVLEGADIKSSWETANNLPRIRKELERKTNYDCKPINPHRVFKEMNEYFGDDAIFTTGCGITQIWSGQLQEIDTERHYLASGGAGCLGYDIPAAFGAAIATGKQTVAVMGDFGFTFHVQELAVCAKNDIPVIVVIVNNAYLGLIRQNQNYGYGYEYAVEMEENQGFVDYVKVAEGFGCYGERVFDANDIKAAFKRAQESGKPAVIDIICDPKTDCSMGSSLANVKEFVY